MLFTTIVLFISFLFGFTSPEQPKDKKPFDWNNATVYFMLTDRFKNGDPSNDMNFGRNTTASKKLRTFVGGDLKGITQKIEEGYFNDLGIDAIWFSPVNEQIHGSVDEGQGKTYAFHGYWIKDWTAIEPNWGTEQDLKELMKVAHKNNIRVLMDVIINHTGPVTWKDPVWPSEWVRTEPQCTYQSYESTVFCTLVKNLPDIRTDQTKEVELPKALKEKWEKEGRLQKELDELDAFFARTGYPRTPRYYIIKWITDYIRKYGIDGFRVDTVKHTEASVWADLAKEAKIAFEEWKKRNQEAIQEDQEFFMLAETYNYNANNGLLFDFGDKKVDYYANGFDSQINFGFKGDAHKSYEELFSSYSGLLNGGALSNVTFMNYVSSHDDSHPFDKERKRTFESATKLLLSPGQAQIYYGDEIARPLIIEGAQGDVNLRSIMDWGDNSQSELLSHWQKLGKFRQAHPSVGAGKHQMISEEPYVFSRTYNKNGVQDQVVVALDLKKGKTSLNVNRIFEEGTKVRDAYSDKTYEVKKGKLKVSGDAGVVLLEEMK
jgi:alpha-amylase